MAGIDPVTDLADRGLEEWMSALPEEDTEALLDGHAGKPVRWVSGEGWVQDRG